MTALSGLRKEINRTPVYLAALAARDEQAPILTIFGTPHRLALATISQPHRPDNKS